MAPSSQPLIFRARAKINLSLHITGRRDDGYHLLDSLVTFAEDIADVLIVNPADDFRVTFTGPFGALVEVEDNLVRRAALLYQLQTGVDMKVHIQVEKNIPIGAGLGGGSADAAATIRALEAFYKKALPDKSALVSLGADVPVCYHDKPCRFTGIGDLIEPVRLPRFNMSVIWPKVHSSSKEVFARREPGFIQRQIPSSTDLAYLQSCANDLEEPAIGLHPIIQKAKDFMAEQQGCKLARMSGSGSAVFGIFDTAENAEFVDPPHWWAKATRTA